MKKSSSSKFSDSVDANTLIEDLWDDIHRFIRYLAAKNATGEILMDEDEISGELMLELVKGVQYYADRKMSRSAMLAVLRKMMDNRIAELRHRYYGTHRKSAASNISLDDTYGGSDDPISEIIPDDFDVEEYTDSGIYVNEVRVRLSPIARIVFDTIVEDSDDRLGAFIRLATVRRRTVSGSVKITQSMVANASIISIREVRRAYDEIVNTIRSLDNASEY